MQALVLGVTPVRYGHYGSADSPLKYERGPNAGKVIETVDVLVPSADGTAVSRTMTLGAHINGDRPPVGTPCDVLVTVGQKQEVWFRRDGREQIITRDKWRAEEFRPAAEPAPK
jgi:hypothetical protein